MKKVFSLVAGLLMTGAVFAQSPEKFSYQAVARDASGLVIANQNVGMRISILQGSTAGASVYTETFAPTTNDFGLINLEIGTGTVVSGTFASIDWSSGPYFIQVEMDELGGTSYALLGASELSSVPYALHAKTAANTFSGSFDDLTDVPANLDTDATDDFSGSFDDLTDVPANLDTDATDDFSGSFNDLTNVPANLDTDATDDFSGSFNDLTNVPANLDTDATDDFSGSFNDLTNVPANLDTDATDDFSGSFNDLTNVPANLDTDATDDFSGSFNDLTNVPANLDTDATDDFSGSFNDLTNVPANLDTDATDDFSGSFNDLTNVPANLDTDATDDFSGSFNDLTNVPANLDTDATDDFSGNYNDLTNKPTLFSGSFSDLTNVPANLDTDATDDFSGNYNDLTNKPDLSAYIPKPDSADSLDILQFDGTNWVASDVLGSGTVGNTGGGRPMNNMQPYLTVNFCIALQGIFPSRSFEPFLGQIQMFGFNFAPRAWAFCDGQLLPINQNQALFSLLGTIYGGDGRTTFALPDLRGRAAIHEGQGPGLSNRRLGSKGGAETHTQSILEMPSHNHTITFE